MTKKAILAGFVLALLPLYAHGQQAGTNSSSLINIHVSQSLPTVAYQANGSTRVDFVGTALLPRATGQAKISSGSNGLRIQANFKGLEPPENFGSAYLVYVLWAITPDGSATNLGQLMVKNEKSSIDVTTKLQSFGMMVTAEPYFAVAFPSEKVVMANSVRSNTKGAVSEVNAHMALLKRGTYPSADFPALAGINGKSKAPLDLYQAQNAVRIARFEQAGKYAPQALDKAEQLLRQAGQYQQRKQKHSVITVARQAVQSAEDAREIAVQQRRQEEVASQEAASQAQAAQAQAQAAQAQAQAAQAKAQAQLQAEQRKLAQERQALAEKQAAVAQAQREAAEKEAQSAQQAAAQALQEKQQLRSHLLALFNRVLPTTDTPRGLQVNLGDVLFATGKSNLRPAAKEALARFSGIVLNYPTLKFSVEGYTDNTGSESLNQTLSENRADAVQNYLIQQGVDPKSITAVGLGESNPVASNSTAAGRQKNRRVEIIVSGSVIGTAIGRAVYQ